MNFMAVKNVRGYSVDEDGVENTEATEQVFSYNAVHYRFKPNEVKILPEEVARHILNKSRVVVEKNGDVTGQFFPLKEISMDEAVKSGVKLPEHPAAEQARALKADKERIKAEIKDEMRREILAEIQAEKA